MADSANAPMTAWSEVLHWHNTGGIGDGKNITYKEEYYR
jgi:hypothetical protein